MSIEQPAPTNPLSGYFRQPKVYVKLPSQGRFYPEGALDVSETGDYPVYSMTAKDELMFKTPDALLNGQATIEIIKSCVPAIRNPWSMPGIDLDAVLIAIRIATYGDSMDVRATCPSCKNVDNFSMDLVAYLNRISNFEYESEIAVDELIIHIRPYTYKEITKMSIKALEQEKIFGIVNDPNMSDEEKINKFGESFVKLTDLTVDIVAGCVCKVVTPEGEVTDEVIIREFVHNAPKSLFDQINDRINKIKEQLELKIHNLTCSACDHVYDSSITVDQSNFFEVRS